MSAEEVAKKLGVGVSILYYWERGSFIPRRGKMIKILTFLGYDPGSAVTHLYGKQIFAYRRSLGLSLEQLSKQIGVDESTLGSWERNKEKPSEKMLKKLKEFWEMLERQY